VDAWAVCACIVTRVRRWLAVVLSLVAFAATAAPARAQGGGGLYEPFPEPAPLDQARRFIERLPGQRGSEAAGLSDRQLERGQLLSGSTLAAARGPGPASARGGEGVDAGLFHGWLTAFAALALAAATSVAVLRRAH
jgi:hypothetical protein